MKKITLFSFAVLLAFMLVGCTTDSQVVQESPKVDYDYLVLVNKQHKLPEDWEANVELVEVQNAYDETIRVEKEALEKYYELRDALLAEGVDIELDSAYRSVSRQEELWTEFEEKYGIDYTKTYVAVPGYSEHHTALAIDICIKKDGVLIYENEDMMKEPEIFAKIHEKLADYGFILRYLEGKEDITGYGYEPWHLRYIGDVEIAKEIAEKGLTLEEYLGDTQNPAVYCEMQGGMLESKLVEGEKLTFCSFNDESSCEIESFYNNECKKGEIYFVNGMVESFEIDDSALLYNNLMVSYVKECTDSTQELFNVFQTDDSTIDFIKETLENSITICKNAEIKASKQGDFEKDSSLKDVVVNLLSAEVEYLQKFGLTSNYRNISDITDEDKVIYKSFIKELYLAEESVDNEFILLKSAQEVFAEKYNIELE